jgi:hypothetical protein
LFIRAQLGMFIRGLSAEAPQLPCAESASGPLDAAALRAWADVRDEIHLVSWGSLAWVDRGNRPPQFFTFSEGEPVSLPDDCLLVEMNPEWFIPEEVHPSPRDERFAHVVEAEYAWDPRRWWYDTGNFGSVGLVVRTIAEVWGIDVVKAIHLMEPLHLQADGDHRPALPISDGRGTVRVTALRMRRPSQI